MPPVSGSAAATSASDSAPQSVMIPPTTHRATTSPGCGTFWAIPAGDRKMPDPIVIPTTSATELQRPSVRGNLSVMRAKPTPQLLTPDGRLTRRGGALSARSMNDFSGRGAETDNFDDQHGERGAPKAYIEMRASVIACALISPWPSDISHFSLSFFRLVGTMLRHAAREANGNRQCARRGAGATGGRFRRSARYARPSHHGREAAGSGCCAIRAISGCSGCAAD